MTEPAKEDLCDCELRNRLWNGYGRCLRCGRKYIDRRPPGVEQNGKTQVPNNQEIQPSDDEARVARIQQARFERGRMDAQMGEPPTEASSEYQKGYEEGTHFLRFALKRR